MLLQVLLVDLTCGAVLHVCVAEAENVCQYRRMHVT
jgi:hypothetical protein